MQSNFAPPHNNYRAPSTTLNSTRNPSLMPHQSLGGPQLLDAMLNQQQATNNSYNSHVSKQSNPSLQRQSNTRHVPKSAIPNPPLNTNYNPTSNNIQQTNNQTHRNNQPAHQTSNKTSQIQNKNHPSSSKASQIHRSSNIPTSMNRQVHNSPITSQLQNQSDMNGLRSNSDLNNQSNNRLGNRPNNPQSQKKRKQSLNIDVVDLTNDISVDNLTKLRIKITPDVKVYQQMRRTEIDKNGQKRPLLELGNFNFLGKIRGPNFGCLDEIICHPMIRIERDEARENSETLWNGDIFIATLKNMRLFFQLRVCPSLHKKPQAYQAPTAYEGLVFSFTYFFIIKSFSISIVYYHNL